MSQESSPIEEFEKASGGGPFTFGFSVNKKDPKPDAPRYKFSTIEEMFSIMTVENHERLLKDFCEGMKIAVYLREATVSVAEAIDTEGVEMKDQIKMSSFEWIDD